MITTILISVLLLALAIGTLVYILVHQKEDPRQVPDALKRHLGLDENNPREWNVPYIVVEPLQDAVVLAISVLFYVIVFALFVVAAVGMAGILPFCLWLLIGYVGWKKAYRRVPLVTIGIGLRYGKRTARVYLEGPHVIIPFMEEIILVDQELTTKTVAAPVTTKDRLFVMFDGSLQFRVFYKITDRRGRNRYVELDPSTIASGINDAIEQELSVIAGANAGRYLYEQRGIITLIIEAVLQLEKKPHAAGNWNRTDDDDEPVYDLKFSIPPKVGDEEDFRKELQGRYGLTTPPEGFSDLIDKLSPDAEIPPELRILFYLNNEGIIRGELEGVKGQDSVSPIEARYGIDIVTFALARVTFSPDTVKAQEAERQAKLFNKAVELFKEQGADDPVASALAWYNKATQNNINFQGLEGAFEALGRGLASVLGGRNGGTS